MSRMVAFAAAGGVRAAGLWRAFARRAGIALLAAAATLAAPGAEAAPATLVLQLNGPADFEYAGYFAALWKGFYDAAGLSVEIRPGSMLGQPRIDPVHEVTEDHAQFGVGTMTLIVRAGQGMPLVLLAPVFQASGTEIYYRAAADFASPGALAKANIGLYPATDVLGLELATALRGDGIDPGKVRSTALDPSQAVAALADRRVDAVAGSAWVLPWQARARGLSLKSINPADYRVEFYGDTLFTLARFARDHPDTVRRFRDASLKGWAYALDHADEIAARLVKDLPPPPGISDAAGFARYQIGVARELARYPAVPLGHSSLERWSRIEQSLADSGALVRASGPASFVYDPAAESGRRSEWRDRLIIAALLAPLVAIAALLLWRRRRAAGSGAPAADEPTVHEPVAHEPAAREPVAPEPEIGPAAETAAATVSKAEPAPPPEPRLEPAPEPAAQPALQSPAPLWPALPSPEPAPATTDLNALLSELEPVLRDRMPQSAAFRLSLLPELWPCRTDRAAVAALVSDLVVAAVADLRPDDTLIVGTRNAAFDLRNLADHPGARIGEFARITVRDSGPGMAEEVLGRIFDLAATSRLAVAAAQPAMARLGGYARAESAEGVGTAIHLYFPRVAIPAAATDDAHAAHARPPAKRYKASGSRVTQRRSRSLR